MIPNHFLYDVNAYRQMQAAASRLSLNEQSSVNSDSSPNSSPLHSLPPSPVSSRASSRSPSPASYHEDLPLSDDEDPTPRYRDYSDTPYEYPSSSLLPVYSDGSSFYEYPGQIPPPGPPSSYYSEPSFSPTLHSTPLRHVPGHGWNEAGCGVCAIACVAGVDYAQARPHALAAGYAPHKGMKYFEMQQALASMGIDSEICFADHWSDFPNLAIISAMDQGLRTPESGGHCVVFQRNGHQEIIYDSLRLTPVERTSDYEIQEQRYLKINP